MNSWVHVFTIKFMLMLNLTVAEELANQVWFPCLVRKFLLNFRQRTHASASALYDAASSHT